MKGAERRRRAGAFQLTLNHATCPPPTVETLRFLGLRLAFRAVGYFGQFCGGLKLLGQVLPLYNMFYVGYFLWWTP
jgi:hypothetical protein